MTPAEQAAAEAAHASLVANVRTALVDYSLKLWGSLSDWRDTDIERFVAQIVPRVEAGKATVASLTDTYLRAVTGVPATADAVLDSGELADLRGVTPDTLYQRPAASMRTALSQGSTFSQALAAGATRLQSLVTTDLQLAKTHQAQRTMSRARGFDGFKRVVHGHTCALCLIASTQLYHHGDLLPIHPGCDCSPEPVRNAAGVVSANGAVVLDPDTLAATHQAMASAGFGSDVGGRSPDYRKFIVTREHGEIGPVITLKDHQFTGPNDLGKVGKVVAGGSGGGSGRGGIKVLAGGAGDGNQKFRRWTPPLITDEDRNRVLSKHLATATVAGKTHTPAGWTAERYFEAVEETRTSPLSHVRHMGDKDVFEKEVDGVWMLVQERRFDDGHAEFWTAFPVKGNGVTHVRKDGRIEWRPLGQAG